MLDSRPLVVAPPLPLPPLKNLNVVEFCRQIAKHLFFPPVKLHCSMLAEDAIKAAVKDYQKKQGEANGETFEA
ncbi:unnamed protein product [Brassica rapa]|uniref:NIF system FeS cluster assembly NifU N-terminal domain-containing protein n=1 Tax=Brassica campestris TaxID=3711 RepID=A0A3P5Y9Z8_BRACM|nr:unnamed protein product [Brassica rapa]VDC60614.1 unnamed protein product [Brassica rapa]